MRANCDMKQWCPKIELSSPRRRRRRKDDNDDNEDNDDNYDDVNNEVILELQDRYYIDLKSPQPLYLKLCRRVYYGACSPVGVDCWWTDARTRVLKKKNNLIC